MFNTSPKRGVLYRRKLHVVVIAMRSWQMPLRELILRSRVVDPFNERRTNSATVFGDTDDCRSKPIFVDELRNQCDLRVSDKLLRRPSSIQRDTFLIFGEELPTGNWEKCSLSTPPNTL